MRYRRQESLRYTFPTTLDATFVILLNYDDEAKLHKTHVGELEIIDLSPGGMKFATYLDLPLSNNQFLMEVSFTLANEEIKLTGKIAWKKSRIKDYLYGLEAIDSEEKEQEIIKMLKKLHKLQNQLISTNHPEKEATLKNEHSIDADNNHDISFTEERTND